MSDTTETTGTTGSEGTPSLSSRVGSFFDEQTKDGAIGFVVKGESKAESKPESRPESKEILEKKAEEKTEASGESEAPAEETEDSDESESQGAVAESEDEPDAEFTEAAKKHNVNVTLDDIPEEARPIVQKKLKDMERGFTKAMQEARQYRTEKAEFDAQIKNLDHFIADKIASDPTLADKINAEVVKRQDPTYREALEMKREAAKDRALTEARNEQEAEAANRERGEYLESYTASAAKSAGIPFAFVEEAVALAVSNNRNISDEDIQKIVQSKARVYKQHIGATKGAKTRELVKEKASDAKNAGLKAVPATAARSNASRQSAHPNADDTPRPMTLREKLEATLDERQAA